MSTDCIGEVQTHGNQTTPDIKRTPGKRGRKRRAAVGELSALFEYGWLREGQKIRMNYRDEYAVVCKDGSLSDSQGNNFSSTEDWVQSVTGCKKGRGWKDNAWKMITVDYEGYTDQNGFVLVEAFRWKMAGGDNQQGLQSEQDNYQLTPENEGRLDRRMVTWDSSQLEMLRKNPDPDYIRQFSREMALKFNSVGDRKYKAKYVMASQVIDALTTTLEVVSSTLRDTRLQLMQLRESYNASFYSLCDAFTRLQQYEQIIVGSQFSPPEIPAVALLQSSTNQQSFVVQNIDGIPVVEYT